MQLLHFLQNRLQQSLPSQEALYMMFPNIRQMPDKIPEDAKLSAVMIALYEKKGEWHFLAIRRSEDGHAHSGQIAFPGGRKENTDSDLLQTALRETFEEIGLAEEFIQPIGALSPIYIPVSNYKVFPYIGHILNLENIVASQDEVTEILEVRLADILNPNAKVETTVTSPVQPNTNFKVNAYQLPDQTIIWGATAIILAELELLLRELDAFH